MGPFQLLKLELFYLKKSVSHRLNIYLKDIGFDRMDAAITAADTKEDEHYKGRQRFIVT